MKFVCAHMHMHKHGVYAYIYDERDPEKKTSDKANRITYQ